MCVPLRLVPTVEPIIVRLRSRRFRDLDPLDDPDIRRDVIVRADAGVELQAEERADVDDSEMEAAAAMEPQAIREMEVDAGQRRQSGLQSARARAHRELREGAGAGSPFGFRCRGCHGYSSRRRCHRLKSTDSAAALCLWLFL